MNTILYLALAALRYVDAQNSLAALDGLPSPPASAVPSTPTPLQNAALWQQAIAIDTASNVTGTFTNRYFYSQIAWWQSLENSSNSYTAGTLSSMESASYVSQLLEVLESYPTRFDQAQASDPNQTPSNQIWLLFGNIVV